MKNTFGSSITMTVFGESHGSAVGVVVDGLMPGLDVDSAKIAANLARRAPQGAETARRDSDSFKILSGVFNGKTTGTPLTIALANDDAQSCDYQYGAARPSHADYAAFCKYHGYENYRGGGHFSGRVTAPFAAAGAVFETALEKLNIRLASHILSCGDIEDIPFSNPQKDIELLLQSDFPVLDKSAAEKMQKEISDAKSEGDSVGGIVQTAVIGLPAGLGEPWFDSIEGVISHVMFSIGGIKGIDFGAGFACSRMRGSEYNDPMRIENNAVAFKSNNSGGVNGGITNSMPLVFQCAVRPTASIAITQDTVDFLRNVNVEISVAGRHDACILRRVCPVIDSMTAFVLCDMLAQRYGTDVFARGLD